LNSKRKSFYNSNWKRWRWILCSWIIRLPHPSQR